MRAAAVVVFAFVSAFLSSAVAHARATADVPYTLPETYSTALRFVRVDRGCAITDRDGEAAYILFDCKDGERSKRGAIELFPQKRGVRVQVTLGDDTHAMELRFVELIERKLRDERGAPSPPSSAPAAPPAASGDRPAPHQPQPQPQP
jgi:hypothetical protein